jgi:DNA-directed RNA polymerase subunit RPC12/RpoP
MLESEWGYRCSRCNNYLPADHFHNDKSKPPFFIAYTCKECRKNADEHQPILYQSDRDAGLEILTRLGYDIEGNVHEQFMERMRKKYGKL